MGTSMQTLIKALLAILLMTSLSWAESTVVVVGQPTVAASSYVFEEDFADNSAGWGFNNGGSITGGYLQLLNGSYANGAIDIASVVTQGVQYTATFEVTYMSGGANWLRFEYPVTTPIGGYFTATGTYSRTFTAGATGVIRFIINDNAAMEYRIDNFRICEGATCN